MDAKNGPRFYIVFLNKRDFSFIFMHFNCFSFREKKVKKEKTEIKKTKESGKGEKEREEREREERDREKDQDVKPEKTIFKLAKQNSSVNSKFDYSLTESFDKPFDRKLVDKPYVLNSQVSQIFETSRNFRNPKTSYYTRRKSTTDIENGVHFGLSILFKDYGANRERSVHNNPDRINSKLQKYFHYHSSLTFEELLQRAKDEKSKKSTSSRSSSFHENDDYF